MRTFCVVLTLLSFAKEAAANMTMEMIDGICGEEAVFVGFGFEAAENQRDQISVWQDEYEATAKAIGREERLFVLFKKGYDAWPDSSVSDNQFSECATRIEQCGDDHACMFGE